MLFIKSEFKGADKATLACMGEEFFKVISKTEAGTWPVFRVLRKSALDLKP